MFTFAAILLTFVVGLFLGSQVTGAREAHTHFTSDRDRTTKDFTAWIRHGLSAVLGVAGLLFLLYVLLVQFPIR